MNGFCGGTDNVNYQAGVRQHWYVAAVDSVRGGAHALGYEAFKIRVNRAVVVGHDVPTRLRPPSDAWGISTKQVGRRRIMRGPNKFLLLFGKVSREAHDALRTHPGAAVGNFDILEHVGNWELRLLALRSFVGVGGPRAAI